MQDQLLETWEIHNRVNFYLLDAIQQDNFLVDISTSGGRNVGDQFGHIHNVRLMWLEQAAPDLAKNLQKIEKGQAIAKEFLRNQLNDSAKAISALLKKAFEDGKVKGFKPHPAAFLGYLISHESHHRGQIALSLKQSGHPIDRKAGFGMWEWGSR